MSQLVYIVFLVVLVVMASIVSVCAVVVSFKVMAGLDKLNVLFDKLISFYSSGRSNEVNAQINRTPEVNTKQEQSKESVSKVPEIEPEKFAKILANPPRPGGGFGVVKKDN